MHEFLFCISQEVCQIASRQKKRGRIYTVLDVSNIQELHQFVIVAVPIC